MTAMKIDLTPDEVATATIEAVETVSDSGKKSKTKTAKEPTPVITFDEISSCQDTLLRATSLSLREIKRLHEEVKKGTPITIAKDCTLSRTQRVFTLVLPEKDITHDLSSESNDFKYEIHIPKLPKANDYNRGKQYEGRLSLFANMLRSISHLHKIREIEIANMKRHFDKVTLQCEFQVIIPYTASIEHIAHLVAHLVTQDLMTHYIVMATLCEKFGGKLPTKVDVADKIKLGRINTLKASL